MQNKVYNAIVILGATATGKTSLAVKCAKKFNGEIISADSRQVYKELNLGSGKDLDEYGNVEHHLIDICDLNSEYNVFKFKNDCLCAFKKIILKNKLPIIVGGTGLYLSAVLQNYNLVYVPKNEELRAKLQKLSLEELGKILLNLKPEVHNKSDLQKKERAIRAIEIEKYKQKNPKEPKQSAEKTGINALVFKIDFPRAVLKERIKKRLQERIQQGMIAEVESCIKKYGEERILWLGLEYKFTALFLKNEFTYEEYFEKLSTAIYQFSKRQETWFNKMQREGVKMFHLDGRDKEKMLNIISKKISLFKL